MQQIRFQIKNHDDQFYKKLRGRVEAYLATKATGKYGNWLILVKFVLFLGLYWMTYGLIVSGHLSPGLTVLGYAALGVLGLLVAFNISHDGTHDTLTPYKPLNKLIYYLTFNPLGTDAYLWKLRHNLSHHIFPNVDDCDADIDSNFLVRLSPNRPLLKHHRFQRFYAPFLYLLYTLHWVFIKDVHYLFRRNLANLRNIKHPAGEVVGFILAKILYLFYLIYVPIFVVGLEVTTVLLGFVALHFSMSYFFLFTNIMNHHSQEADFPRRDADGFLPGSWARHQMATCLDFHPTNFWWNFFFGGFNSHCAHHLFPEVCHVHYVEISKIIDQTAAEFGIEHKQNSWWRSLLSHFRHLKDLGSIPPNTTTVTPKLT